MASAIVSTMASLNATVRSFPAREPAPSTTATPRQDRLFAYTAPSHPDMTGDSIAGRTGDSAAQRAMTVLQQATGTQGIAAAAREARAAYERLETPAVTIDDVRSAAVRIR